eukprot:s20_g3.t1
MLLDEVKAKLSGVADAGRITLWCGVGPHFRSYDVAAYMAKEWFSAMTGNLYLCYFAEHHGKGEVDGMFSHMNRWLADHLKKPDALMQTPGQLLQVVMDGASRNNWRDPPERSGVEWVEASFFKDL